MIGQKQLKSDIDELFINRKFPRFSIFIGPDGSGRKTFIQENLVPLWEVTYIAPDIKVESMRDIVNRAYKIHDCLFIIPDADAMSVAAKNALLKVVEECPNNNSFIMTLQDEHNTLSTIRSRATIFHMDNYAPDEIMAYMKLRYTEQAGDDEKLSIIKDICEVPGDVDLFCKAGVFQLYGYVEKVVDNIVEVSGANAFKIAEKVDTKGEGNGFDLSLFWRCFQKVCASKTDFQDKYAEGILITSHYLQDLRVRGINRQFLMDNWILEMREVWR